ncbi:MULTISPECIES: hypothetical protein [unclassified Microbacterium]|uniref:hypothetical protein n=1 Tax=unclassified Microbacterium TaxID=2609290 RepID=UPI0012F73B78|nr:hypothetical protein [Microbacterium sp. MAH-37]MVQ42117.1 hypothetical protein [Microbacterium sp. MAH-37]
MNEIQGPTPAGTSRPYRNLPDALRAHRVPEENHAFITRIVDAIGISSFIDRGRYIEAIRRGPGAALHIGRTYTNGFTEEELVVVGFAAQNLKPSEGRPPYYYVSHPSEFSSAAQAKAKRAGAPRAAAQPVARTPKVTPKEERDYGVCDVCFMVKTPSGGCGCD